MRGHARPYTPPLPTPPPAHPLDAWNMKHDPLGGGSIHDPNLRRPKPEQLSHEYSPDGYDHGLAFHADKPWEHMPAYYPPVSRSAFDHPLAAQSQLTQRGLDYYHPDGRYVDMQHPKQWVHPDQSQAA